MYIVTSGMNPNEDHIQHYGVLGMKWGVHRYRNPDVSFTEKGKNKFEKVSKSNFRQTLETRAAKAHMARTWYAAKKKERKLLKEADKMEKEGKPEQLANMKRIIAKKVNSISKQCETNFKDIESGKIKAGRDFITQKDFDHYLLFTKNEYRTHFKDQSRTVNPAGGFTIMTSGAATGTPGIPTEGIIASDISSTIYINKLRKAMES